MIKPDQMKSSHRKEEASSRMVSFIGVKTRRKLGRFDLATSIVEDVRRNSLSLEDCDILVISSKYAAMSEGSYVRLNEVVPTKTAVELSKRYSLDPRLAQMVLQESQEILGGVLGFALAITKDGTLAPNAGIDRSNVPKGFVILYPRDPEALVMNLRESLIKLWNKKGKSSSSKVRIRRLGIVLSDSRIVPTRLGTTGVALAVAGFRPVIDLRGKRDLFGNTLKVTMKAVADQIASGAEILMGESSESIPIVIARGIEASLFFREGKGEVARRVPLTIDRKKCLIINGLRNALAKEEAREDILSSQLS